jgi:hypothetical protein
MLEACSKAAIQAAAQAPPHLTENIGACLAGEDSSSQMRVRAAVCGYYGLACDHVLRGRSPELCLALHVLACLCAPPSFLRLRYSLYRAL